MLRLHLPLPTAEAQLDSLIASLANDLTLSHGKRAVRSVPDRVGGWFDFNGRGTQLVIVKEGEGWVDFGSTHEPIRPGDVLIWDEHEHVRVGPVSAKFGIRELETTVLTPHDVRTRFDLTTPRQEQVT